MLFRELKPGNTLYFLNRMTMDMQAVPVASVSGVHITTDKRKISANMFLMCVDVTVTIGDKTQVIEVPEAQSYTISDDQTLLITPNDDALANGIRSVRKEHEEQLKLVNQRKAMIKRCDELLPKFDPLYKQNADNEQRFTVLQSVIQSQSEMIKSQNEKIEELSNALKKLLK